jgi:hypothetical protein
MKKIIPVFTITNAITSGPTSIEPARGILEVETPSEAWYATPGALEWFASRVL